MYSVYVIKIDNKVRYVGYTNDTILREKQHNYLFSKKKKKILYDKVRLLHPDIKELKLEVIKEFSKRIEAKRYECYLILKDYFKSGQLWQKIPNISDR